MLVTRHPVVKKHDENRLKFFVHVFMKENNCLNCFKVDRIQNYEKNYIYIYMGQKDDDGYYAE